MNNFDLLDNGSWKALKVPRHFRGDWGEIVGPQNLINTDDEGERRNRNQRSTKRVLTGKYITNRCRAARDAESYSWKFARVHEPICDVDIDMYPYELVRQERLPETEIEAEKQQYQREYFQTCQNQWQQDGQQQWMPSTSQQQQHPDTRSCFLDSFDSDYIQTVARALRGTTAEGEMTVKACFGRTLFRLHTPNSGRKYLFNDLRNLCCPRDIKSSWSNVCDVKAPVMHKLVEELNRTSAVNMNPSKLKLTMRCCLETRRGAQYAKLFYFRENDTWTFAEVRALSDVYACHDISLNNCTSFRVKVFAELVAPSKTWWNSIQDLVLLDESNGDPFKTKVNLVSCAQKELSIEFVTIKRVSGTVNYRGLCFQLSSKQGCISLQALLPREMLVNKQVDESVEFLVSRLVEILDELC